MRFVTGVMSPATDPSPEDPQGPAGRTPLAGVFWMLITGLCFLGVTALVKVVGPDVPPAQSAFLRYALGLVFLLPMIPALRRTRFTPRLWRLFTIRGVAHTAGVICWFYAMTRLPIAEVTAMNYLNPVYVTVLATIFLGERLHLRRILAIATALVGALIILRPGFRELDPGHFAMLFTAAVFAIGYLCAKILSDETEPAAVVAMLSITVTIGLAPLAIATWVPPTPVQLMWLFGVACFATAGHFTMTLAFRAAPLTVTQPVTFLQLVWATLLGVLVFSEPVDVWVIVGGGLIIAAITFITWREAVLNRRRITPSVPETKG
ncbi:EamA family transporter [Rhodobacterales bacterium HKCCE2091]|nr:EamA family transporter [Rhodobacterales bacterium HKCCE2091]